MVGKANFKGKGLKVLMFPIVNVNEGTGKEDPNKKQARRSEKETLLKITCGVITSILLCSFFTWCSVFLNKKPVNSSWLLKHFIRGNVL